MMSLPCDALSMNSPHNAKQETEPMWPERTARDRYEWNPDKVREENWDLISSNSNGVMGLYRSSSLRLLLVLELVSGEDNNGVERVGSGREADIVKTMFLDSFVGKLIDVTRKREREERC